MLGPKPSNLRIGNFFENFKYSQKLFCASHYHGRRKKFCYLEFGVVLTMTITLLYRYVRTVQNLRSMNEALLELDKNVGMWIVRAYLYCK